MESIIGGLIVLLLALVGVIVRGQQDAKRVPPPFPNGPTTPPPLPTGTTQTIPPTNAHKPNPDTGAPEPKPDEEYPEPGQSAPEDYPAPEPAPAPAPTPAPATRKVYTAAEQDAFLKAVGLPHGSAAKRKASWELFQAATIWPDYDGKLLVADGDCGPRTTYVAEYARNHQDYRISRFFHLYEFRCKGRDAAQGSGRHCSSDCRVIHIERAFVALLDIVRERVYKGPLAITTGYRCAGYNAHVGGIKGSAHTLGVAADIPRRFPASSFVGLGFHGIGKSRVDRSSVVHLDLASWLPRDYVFQE